MSNQLLAIVLTVPQTVVLAYAITTNVHFRKPAVFMGIYILYCNASSILAQTALLPQQETVDAISLIFAGAVLPMLLTADKKTWALFASTIYHISLMLADATVTAVTAAVWKVRSASLVNTMLASRVNLLAVKLGLLAVISLYCCLAHRVLARHFIAEKSDSRGILFLMVPVSQLVTLDLLLVVLETETANPRATEILVIIIAVSVFADFAYFRAIATLRQMDMLERQVALTEQELNNQLAYYQQMEDNITQVNQLRHDMKNQLQTAYLLFERDEKVEAARQLNVLRRTLDNRVGSRFSANLIVDAVLTEKARACDDAGISLDIRLELPPNLSIEGAHLCSVFANVLDNAIAGCRASGTSHPQILLSAFVKQGFLIIRCQNSAPPNPKRSKKQKTLLPAHGLGLGILQRIAEIYHGALSTRQENGQYFTSVTLQFTPDQPETLPSAASFISPSIQLKSL